MINDIARGITTGLFMGFVLFYSLRPTVPYPAFVLQSFEHPWVFIIMIVFAIYLLIWDRTIGCLAFIIIACLVIDFHLYSKKPIKTEDSPTSSVPTPITMPDDKYRNVAIRDVSGAPLNDVGIDESNYPLFSDTEVEMRPGYPSPY